MYMLLIHRLSTTTMAANISRMDQSPLPFIHLMVVLKQLPRKSAKVLLRPGSPPEKDLPPQVSTESSFTWYDSPGPTLIFSSAFPNVFFHLTLVSLFVPFYDGRKPLFDRRRNWKTQKMSSFKRNPKGREKKRVKGG